MPLTRLKMAVFAPMPRASVIHGDECEAGAAAQQAHAVAKILREILEPTAAPLIARDVLDQGDVAEFAVRDCVSLLWSSAAISVIAGGHFEVARDFLFERVLFFVVAIVG